MSVSRTSAHVNALDCVRGLAAVSMLVYRAALVIAGGLSYWLVERPLLERIGRQQLREKLVPRAESST